MGRDRREEFLDAYHQFQTGAMDRRGFIASALGLGLSASTLGSLLTACGGGDTAATPPPEGDVTPKEGDVPVDGPELGEMEKELSIYNWSDYIAEETIPGFEKEFGVKVSYNTYESNEEMMSKLQIGAGGYDLVVPTGYIVTVLAAQNLLAPLSKRYLTNWANVSPVFHDPEYDKGNRFAVPWQWGTTGIAYRTDKITTPPDSWAVFHDAKLKGKMTMMDDQRDVIGSWLRFHGFSSNSTSPEELNKAKESALLAKPNLAAFLSAPVKAQLVAGDVWLSQLWDGDTVQAKAEQANIGYVLPKEGSTIWTDSLVIPAGAPHKRAAHEFMNYIMRPDIAAQISGFTGYGTPNAKAMEVMGDAAVPYPTEDQRKRLEYQKDLGQATELWDQIWTEIKAG